MKRLKIKNVNSKFDITGDQKEFIEDILNIGNIGLDDVPSLINKIPIYLIDKKTMPDRDHLYDFDNYKIDFEQCDNKLYPVTELIGFYRNSGDKLIKEAPFIAICLERIEKCVMGNAKEYMYLLAKVITHEFAHAYMDHGVDDNSYGKIDETYHWMEESFANVMTLTVFSNFNKKSLYF